MSKIRRKSITAIFTYAPSDNEDTQYTDILSSFYVNKDNTLVGAINIDPDKIPEELKPEGHIILEALQEVLIPLFLFRMSVMDNVAIHTAERVEPKQSIEENSPDDVELPHWEKLHSDFLLNTTEWYNIIAQTPAENTYRRRELASKFHRLTVEMHTLLHDYRNFILDEMNEGEPKTGK